MNEQIGKTRLTKDMNYQVSKETAVETKKQDKAFFLLGLKK